MKKIIIFGNSGSGKSTLAQQLSVQFGVAHLDLDTLAWQDVNPPVREPLNTSAKKIESFLNINEQWVIEGGYADLLEFILEPANEMFFLNLDRDRCINNCKNRAWEPHKYKSLEAQNDNLSMLIEWVKEYFVREDEFSLLAHQKLFNEFKKKKTQYFSNERE